MRCYAEVREAEVAGWLVEVLHHLQCSSSSRLSYTEVRQPGWLAGWLEGWLAA
jgi:hypothetical protein